MVSWRACALADEKMAGRGDGGGCGNGRCGFQKFAAIHLCLRVPFSFGPWACLRKACASSRKFPRISDKMLKYRIGMVHENQVRLETPALTTAVQQLHTMRYLCLFGVQIAAGGNFELSA